MHKEHLNLLDFWQAYADSPDAMYREFLAEALQHLRQRQESVARLKTPEDWRRRQAQMRQTLCELVGPFPEKTPLNARVLSVHQRDGYRMENLLLESQPGLHVTACLYIPDGRRTRGPAILYCTGHNIPGYRTPIYQHTIINLVRKGFVVLAFDPIGQGERLQYFDPSTGRSAIGTTSSVGHTYLGGPAFLAGSPLARHMIWDGIRSLDYLLQRPEVDPARVGITGRSGGGTQTCYIAALDDRLAAAAPECYLTTFEHLLLSRGPQDAEQNFDRGILNGFDQPDFLLLHAPKPCLVVATTRDIFSYEGTLALFEETQRVYQVLGRTEDFQITSDDAEHESTKKNREALYAFFLRTLGVDGDPTDEDVDIPSADELRVTSTGQVSTAIDGKGVPDLLREECDRLLTRLDRARADLPRHLAQVRASANALSGYRPPARGTRAIYSGTYQRAGYVIERHLLATGDRFALPTLVMRPETGPMQRVVLHLHPDGKGVAAEAGSATEQLVQRGCAIVATDITGVGELAVRDSPCSQWFPGTPFKEFFALLQIGRSIVARQAEDVARVLQFIRATFHVPADEVHVIAHGSLVPVVLHAAAIEKCFSGVALVGGLLSYANLVRTRMYLRSHVAALVPSALTAYDLPDLAACIAPKPLLLINPVDGAGSVAGSDQIEEELAVVRQAYATHPTALDLQQGVDVVEIPGKLLRWISS